MGTVAQATPAGSAPFLGVARSALGRRWHLRATNESVISELARHAGVSDAVARVLAARGIESTAAGDFLKPTLKSLMPDPNVLMDMERAVVRVVAAVEANEQIAVFGDYDVDGATS